MKQTIQIALGTEADINRLFPNVPTDLNLQDFIAHTINQSLLRDLMYGSWCEVFLSSDQYGVKITSPLNDLSGYEEKLPALLVAAQKGYERFEELKITDPGLHLLFPFGLPIARAKSVQLLHFPPLECLIYVDYLYSPTNRRWESLLGSNGWPGERNSLLERIVDVVPLAALGGDSKGIEPYNFEFKEYGIAMLKAVLSISANGKATQPIVGYGGPIRNWLEQTFPNEVKKVKPDGNLDVLDIIEIPLVSDTVLTPVICANHPSLYFYLIADNPYEKKAGIMKQDLVAAGWQVAMAENWEACPKTVLANLQASWETDSARMKAIVEEQDSAFGFAHINLPPVAQVE
ncbi:MAG TPA: hypothetical protein EYQ50_19905 [Verrucomicrobiales bacterium]|nr:hypothetical protein [Verrucomicrobiales bacterium]